MGLCKQNTIMPAYESIIVARKPCEGSCVDNVLKYGVGGINIDECRVGVEERTYKGAGASPQKIDNHEKGDTGIGMLDGSGKDLEFTVNGRFPANVILTYDDTDKEEVCGGMPESGNGNNGTPYSYAGREYNNRDSSMFNGDKPQAPSNYNDNGSAARYFYNAQVTDRDHEQITYEVTKMENQENQSIHLYSEGKAYKLYNGNMLDMLEVIEPNSIDAIVTDPPYELGFMGKSWDNSGVSFQKETWEKCLKVLKPGGYLLAFGGSRTSHRIACAIEDAGFEIRDTIMWLYGCYSSDTQVLTQRGWLQFPEVTPEDKILQWDSDTNTLIWEAPKKFYEYDIDDEMVLFENRHTSQLVTKNHNMVVKVRKHSRLPQPTAWEIYEAQDLKKHWTITLPLAGELHSGVSVPHAYMIGWWLTDAWLHNDGKACMFSQSKPETLQHLKDGLDQEHASYSEYTKQPKKSTHNVEHIFYVHGELADYLIQNFPDRKLTVDVLSWDEESRRNLLRGLMDGDGSMQECRGYSRVFWSRDPERLDIFSALCLTLNMRSYVDYKKGCVYFNEQKNTTQIEHRLRKPNQPYNGKVYCFETTTGAFVVRRNGKPFIGRNSGFPKSMNIGLAIDKKNGVDNRTGNTLCGVSKHSDTAIEGGAFSELYEERQAQNEWQGFGTALKPAYEPVIVSRKPCEGTCVDNVLKYGVGGINIDECRIGTDERTYKGMSSHKPEGAGTFRDDNWEPKDIEVTVNGRFPSNVVLTYDETDQEEVCGGMPEGGANGSVNKTYDYKGEVFGDYKQKTPFDSYGDEGSAARYFYCAKASKRDRDEGLDAFEEQYIAFSNQGKAELSRGNVDFSGDPSSPLNAFNKVQSAKNIHPSVKPTDLMEYLVRLVTPKGGTVLDPFNGSGSTGKAVAYENFDRDAGYKYIGIELSDEYLAISDARIKYVEGQIKQIRLF